MLHWVALAVVIASSGFLVLVGIRLYNLNRNEKKNKHAQAANTLATTRRHPAAKPVASGDTVLPGVPLTPSQAHGVYNPNLIPLDDQPKEIIDAVFRKVFGTPHN